MTPEDVVVIPYLINNFDSMELNPKENDNKGNRAIEIRKRINGVSVIATIERGENKEFLVTSHQFVKSDALDASKETPGLNVRNDSDIAKVKKDIETIKESAKNSSKIVDENGEPLEVWHGSPNDFNVFDKEKALRGFYFAPPKRRDSVAGYYGEGKERAFFLNIKNPIEATPNEKPIDNKLPENNDGLVVRADKEWRRKYYNYRTEELEEEVVKKGDVIEIITFSPSQIKSADPVTYDDNGNVIPLSERFNEEKNDIRFSAVFDSATEEMRESVMERQEMFSRTTTPTESANNEQYDVPYFSKKGVESINLSKEMYKDREILSCWSAF